MIAKNGSNVIGVTICFSPFRSQLLRLRRRDERKGREKIFQTIEKKGEKKFASFVTEKLVLRNGERGRKEGGRERPITLLIFREYGGRVSRFLRFFGVMK